jgi:arylsulfatase A-like enzyme
VTFDHAFVSDALCCPSRATILTGQYAHTTGVWQNEPPYGGFPKFRDGSTVATWLRAAGYRTGLFGKYLNQYSGRYVPPGWDRWVAIAGASDPYDLYRDYTLNVNGRLEHHGAGAGDYSTDVLERAAVSFIKDTRGPIFEYFAPYAPHTPSIPAPGDGSAFDRLPPYRPPSFNEADVSDKPAWVRRLPPLSPRQAAFVNQLRRRMYQSLIDVDRAVGAIVDALEDTGRLANTMIVFTSDNGFSWGEHRWVNKVAPYDEDIRVPMVVRFDPAVSRPHVDHHLLANVDLAPTFAAVAGTPAPGAEGLDFVPLLRGRPDPWRSDVLIEHMNLLGIPSLCGLRSARLAYVRYATGEEELYGLERDRWEVANQAGNPAYGEVVQRLRHRVRRLCRPLPPDATVTGPAEG